jgi:hypothetical protein
MTAVNMRPTVQQRDRGTRETLTWLDKPIPLSERSRILVFGYDARLPIPNWLDEIVSSQ